MELWVTADSARGQGRRRLGKHRRERKVAYQDLLREEIIAVMVVYNGCIRPSCGILSGLALMLSWEQVKRVGDVKKAFA